MEERNVVTCFLRNGGEVLLLRRSEAVGSYRGRWGGIAGHVEGEPEVTAHREIAEETGLEDAVTYDRRGDPFTVEDQELGIRWIVHPYLFECAHRDVHLNDETDEAAWVSPAAILALDTVPQLWTSYRRVSPSVESIRTDREHGSAYLSLRAMEVLRDRAVELVHEGVADLLNALRPLAQSLLVTRPAMAALVNRVHRVMHTVRGHAGEDVVGAIDEVIRRAYRNEAAVVRRVAAFVTGRRVFTLSRSGTVVDALLRAEPPAVFIAVSGPQNEGVGVAEELSRAGIDVTLVPDAAVLYALAAENVDLVLLGADAVLPNGDLVNKTGSHMAALGARQLRLPCYVAAAEDKVSTEQMEVHEIVVPGEVYKGDAILSVVNPLFEVTPAALLSGYITEHEILAASQIPDVVFELRALGRWLDDGI